MLKAEMWDLKHPARRVLRLICCLVLAVAVFPRSAEARQRRDGASGRTRPKPVQAADVVERFSGKVVRVSDGDTCDVETASGKVIRI